MSVRARTAHSRLPTIWIVAGASKCVKPHGTVPFKRLLALRPAPCGSGLCFPSLRTDNHPLEFANCVRRSWLQSSIISAGYSAGILLTSARLPHDGRLGRDPSGRALTRDELESPIVCETWPFALSRTREPVGRIFESSARRIPSIAVALAPAAAFLFAEIPLLDTRCPLPTCLRRQSPPAASRWLRLRCIPNNIFLAFREVQTIRSRVRKRCTVTRSSLH